MEFRQRPYSIRTRIKTEVLISVESSMSRVRDHIPLEQGLRPVQPSTMWSHQYDVRDHIPLEQGLRLVVGDLTGLLRASQRPYSIRTRIKTVGMLPCRRLVYVRDHIPLEQGLRHSNPTTIVQFGKASETIFH